MPVKFIFFFLCFSPGILLAKQEQKTEYDLELFEFLAIYEKNDEDFIDAEMDEKTEGLTNQHVKTSESNE